MNWTAEKEHLLITSMDKYKEDNDGANISWYKVHDIWIDKNGDINASPNKLKSKWQLINKFGKVNSNIEGGRLNSMM